VSQGGHAGRMSVSIDREASCALRHPRRADECGRLRPEPNKRSAANSATYPSDRCKTREAPPMQKAIGEGAIPVGSRALLGVRIRPGPIAQD
jgi:hypothetical protein